MTRRRVKWANVRRMIITGLILAIVILFAHYWNY